jgi:Carboxypeptidase regulatory-like domain
MSSIVFRRGGLVLPLALLVGCSGGSGSFATVSGAVTYKGAPVAGARITFFNTTEVSGQRDSYSTTTDDNGKYLIAAVGKNKGIPPATYKVTVVKLEMRPGVPVADPNDLMQIEASGAGVNKLPLEYSDPNRTPLTANLSEGKNDYPIEIKGGK